MMSRKFPNWKIKKDLKNKKGNIFRTSSASGMREEKVSLGITTLLSMSILMLMVSDQMPTTSTFIPLIGRENLAISKLRKFRLVHPGDDSCHLAGHDRVDIHHRDPEEG